MGVVDALAGDARMLERLLDVLGVRHGGVTKGKLLSCPMPDHADDSPSCNPLVDAGMFYCHSRCGNITAAELVIAHGKASSPREAMLWLEDALRIPVEPLRAKLPAVDDPSLSVAQYLALKGLPESTRATFGLQDVRSWVGARSKRAAYDAGFFTTVLMPNRPDRRPRVRSDAPDGKFKWASKVRFLDRKIMDYGEDVWEKDVYGLDQLAQHPGLPNLLVVVEGESDVHALHAMGVPCCVGVPGVSLARDLGGELVEAAAKAALGDPSACSVVVWQEPGTAGAGFPKGVADAMLRACDAKGFAAPSFASLLHSAVPGAPKDPCALWQDRGESAHDVMIQSLHHCLGAASEGAAVPAAPLALAAAPRRLSSNDPWAVFAELPDAPPIADLVATTIKGLGVTASRTEEGWAQRVVKEDEVKHKPICSPLVVERVEQSGEDFFAVLAAPMDGRWIRERFRLSDLASKDRATGLLAALLGVDVVQAQRAAMLDLISSLRKLREQSDGVVEVPFATGWSGSPASSLFAGLECDAGAEFASEMWRANELRRARHPDELSSARAWWDGVVEPLIAEPAGGGALEHAAPVIALGTAAAAPLLMPLDVFGVQIRPVSWLSGLGGGGKTVLQRVCASMFAPKVAGCNGQVAFYMSADVSRAALNSRANFTRDLPLILDDVTQMPAFSNRGQSSEAAKVEAAADLGMKIFNQDPSERANKDGSTRMTRPFRCTALFSAEVSMRSDVGARVTAGHRRRITTVEASPMRDRGLDKVFANAANVVMGEHGGAAGSLLVKRIRAAVSGREVEGMLAAARSAVALIEPVGGVTDTQRESLAVQMLGFALLAEACGVSSWRDGLERAAASLRPYVQAVDGGATRDNELSQADRALAGAVALFTSYSDQFYAAAHSVSFVSDSDVKQGHGKALGKVVWDRSLGKRKVCFLPNAMSLLEREFGVTHQMVSGAQAEGLVKRERQRIGEGGLQHCYSWFLPLSDEDDDDDEPGGDPAPPPHDVDPHGLRRQAEDTAEQEPIDPGLVVSDEPAMIDTVFESATTAATRRIDIGTDAVDCVVFEDLGVIVEASFHWSTGTYHVSPSEADSLSLRERIRKDAWDELAALREMYARHGIEVPEPPAADDPRWAKLDALGARALRDVYEQSREAASAAAVDGLSDGERAARQREYVRLYRIHLMGRLRNPEWFVVVDS